VVLSFPFKDCVLEGGQSKDDEKRKEIFFNEVLAKDEINRLLNKKVITSANIDKIIPPKNLIHQHL
jgi:adenine-specific DNA-methyltransferase